MMTQNYNYLQIIRCKYISVPGTKQVFPDDSYQIITNINKDNGTDNIMPRPATACEFPRLHSNFSLGQCLHVGHGSPRNRLEIEGYVSRIFLCNNLLQNLMIFSWFCKSKLCWAHLGILHALGGAQVSSGGFSHRPAASAGWAGTAGPLSGWVCYPAGWPRLTRKVLEGSLVQEETCKAS